MSERKLSACGDGEVATGIPTILDTPKSNKTQNQIVGFVHSDNRTIVKMCKSNHNHTITHLPVGNAQIITSRPISALRSFTVTDYSGQYLLSLAVNFICTITPSLSKTVNRDEEVTCTAQNYYQSACPSVTPLQIFELEDSFSTSQDHSVKSSDSEHQS